MAYHYTKVQYAATKAGLPPNLRYALAFCQEVLKMKTIKKVFDLFSVCISELALKNHFPR